MLSAFIAAIHECCGLDAETFSTATFAGYIGVAEAKGLVEPFLDEVNLGAINERKAVFVHHNFDAVILEDDIEKIEQADFLIKNKCDFVQGYFYSHPLPQEEFLAFIEKQDFHTQRRKALEIV